MMNQDNNEQMLVRKRLKERLENLKSKGIKL